MKEASKDIGEGVMRLRCSSAKTGGPDKGYAGTGAISLTVLTCRHPLESCMAYQRSYSSWSPNQRFGVVSKARESLKAISGVIAPRSLTTLETVFLETPRILAKSVMEMDR